MRARLFVVLLLVVALTTLAAFAHASPPDPLWIAGLYDGGDEDEAIMAATSADGAAGAASFSLIPALPLIGAPPAIFPAASPCAASPAFSGRAPPSA